MIALEQARTYLEGLGLDQAAAVLENRLDAAANQQLPYAEFLPISWASRPTRAASAISWPNAAGPLPLAADTRRF